MPTSAAKDPRQALGRNPDRLTLVERTALAGKMIALEVYSPATLPLRRIEAIGDSIDACIGMLQERGLDPRRFEYSPLGPAYYRCASENPRCVSTPSGWARFAKSRYYRLASPRHDWTIAFLVEGGRLHGNPA